MKAFFLRPKVTLITIGIILAVILSGIYLYAVLRPGIWLNDAFLYRQDDGSFQGSDNYAQYRVRIAHGDKNTKFTVSINDVTWVYEVLRSGSDVQILRDGVQIFDGYAQAYGDSYYLQRNSSTTSNEPAGGVVGPPEYLSPSTEWLYHQARTQELDTRGNPWMLALAWFCAAWIIVDICFPDLFFRLKYMWHVDGGEPSDIYRTSQMIGRGAMLILIVVVLIMGFNHQ